MPIPTSRNSVSLSPVGANSVDTDPTIHIETIVDAISTDADQASRAEAASQDVPESSDSALKTDAGFQVGTESFANMNEIAVNPKGQKGISCRVYENTATANDGAITIDLHLTLIDTFDDQGNLTTGTPQQLPVTFSDFFGGPILLARNIGESAGGFEGHTAHVKVEFFDSGCGEPLDVIGDFTFRDIDFIPPDGNCTGTGSEAVTAVSAEILSYQVSSDPVSCITIEENDNGTTRFTNYETNGGPDDEERWARIRFNGRKSLNLTFRARNANTGYGLTTADFSGAPSSCSQAEIENDSGTDAVEMSVCAIGGTGNAGVIQHGNYGSIVIDSDGTYTYKLHSNNADVLALSPGQTLDDTFDYSVSDSQGGFSSASLTITIAEANPRSLVGGTVPPQANIDSDSINILNVSTYFSDPQGQSLTYNAVNLPTGLLINPLTGEIAGQLDNNASQDAPGGIFNAEVTATDSNGGSVTTTFEWEVISLVLAEHNKGVMTDQSSSTLDAIAGVEPNAKNLGSFNQISNAAHGVASVNPDGSFIYTANRSSHGTDSFEYDIVDTDGATSTATVTIAVDPASNPPVVNTAIPDQSHANSDTINVDISNNFRGFDGKPLTFGSIGLPPGLTINSAGNISGTIDSNASQNGPYTVVITAVDGNGGKVTDTFGWAISSPEITAEADNLQTNQGSSRGTTVSNKANASPTVNTNIPDQTHAGSGNINVDISPNFTDTSRVGLAFSATGLPPGLSITSSGKICGTIDASTSQVAPYAVVIKAKDANGESITDTFSWGISNSTSATANSEDYGSNKATFNQLTDPSHGSIVFNSDGCFTYTPAPKFSGTDKFEYEKIETSGAVSPATVMIEIQAVEKTNLAAQATNMAAAETDAGVAINGDYGTVQINTDGSYTYALDSSNLAVENLNAGQTTLNADEITLTETFQYTVDGEDGGCTTTNVTLTIARKNGALVLESLPDQSNGSLDTVLVDLTPFAAGLDADNLSFAVTGLPSGLTVSRGIVSGKIASSALAGPYSVTVSVSDGKGGIAMDSFTWNVGDPAPVTADSSSTPQDALSTSSDVDSATSPANENLSASLITTAPSNGTVVANHDGSVTYTPNSGLPQNDSYEYEVCIPSEASEIAVVTVNVAPLDNASKSRDDETVATELESHSSNNFSKPHFDTDTEKQESISRPGISQKIFSLSQKPLFSGYASPSTRITGRIYDASASLVGEASANTDPEGNWSMQFNNAKGHEFYQVEFETALPRADFGNGNFGLHPGGTSYQSMSPLTSLDKPLSTEGAMTISKQTLNPSSS